MPQLEARTSLLLIVDMQAALLPAIAGGDRLLARVARLARAAALLEVPIVATEHCRDKIGSTVDALARFPAWIQQKTHFDATREAEFLRRFGNGRQAHAMAATGATDRPRILLTGAEAHVCVLQTGLGLHRAGFQPVLVKDGIGSRSPEDHQAACERWAYHGLEAVSSEMAMFEWLGSAGHPRFRDVMALIKAG